MKKSRQLTITAMLLAIGFVLPFLTGQIPNVGRMLLPLHLPVLIGGMICGPFWGLALGAILPILRSVIFGMPPMMPTALCMAFELAAYGFFAGLFREKLPKTAPMLFVSLTGSMLLGRIVWGLASIVFYGFTEKAFTWQLFMAGAFINALPGILLQFVVIPPIVLAIENTNKS